MISFVPRSKEWTRHDSSLNLQSCILVRKISPLVLWNNSIPNNKMPSLMSKALCSS